MLLRLGLLVIVNEKLGTMVMLAVASKPQISILTTNFNRKIDFAFTEMTQIFYTMYCCLIEGSVLLCLLYFENCDRIFLTKICCIFQCIWTTTLVI